MMNQTLITLPLREKRDALLARQRARQVASLLGYDFQEQAGIAAGVFAIAWQVRGLHDGVELCFSLSPNSLQVHVQIKGNLAGNMPPLLRLEKPLPSRCKLSLEDMAWAVGKLDRLTPAQMYEEINRLNQELLTILHALQTCQAQLATLQKGNPHAA